MLTVEGKDDHDGDGREEEQEDQTRIDFGENFHTLPSLRYSPFVGSMLQDSHEDQQ